MPLAPVRRRFAPRRGAIRARSLLGVVMLGLTGCSTQPEAAGKLPLVLVASGDTAGWIVPCGCTANQSGGLLRRGAFIDNLRRDADVIYVDVGGAAGGTSPYDRAKFAAILRGEAAMQVAAHNVGLGEAKLGVEYLRELSQSLGIRWLSANVYTKEGEPLGEPVIIIERNGYRVALIGVLDDHAPPDSLRVDPPREAILTALRSVQGKTDSVVVLAYLPEERLNELAANLPEVDLVIGGPTGQSIAPRRLGPTLLVSATNKGKFVARLAAPRDKSQRWSGEVVEMTADIADSQEQSQNLKRFYAELAERDFAPTETEFVSSTVTGRPETFQVAGTAACQQCHGDECEAWEQSGHANAWHSLEHTGSQVDPFCQQCHTQAYGMPGGYRSLQDEKSLKVVGCETCHGPSAAHAADAQASTGFGSQAADQCARCHDRENSPRFGYDAYWARIEHGSN